MADFLKFKEEFEVLVHVIVSIICFFFVTMLKKETKREGKTGKEQKQLVPKEQSFHLICQKQRQQVFRRRGVDS